jgi:hypothetical protein
LFNTGALLWKPRLPWHDGQVLLCQVVAKA